MSDRGATILRMFREDDPVPEAMRNEAAEQALLGALLVQPQAYWGVAGRVRPEHFWSAVHGRILAAIGDALEAGRQPSPVLLAPLFDDDEDLREVGGGRYLMQLAANPVTVLNAGDFADAIRRGWIRRRMVEEAEALAAAARSARPGEDPEDALRAADEALVELLDPGAADGRRFDGGGVASAFDGMLEEGFRNGGRISGLTWGIPSLDEAAGGLEDGGLYVLGARPGQGKSALAFNSTAMANLERGVPALVFSQEMKPASIAARWVAARTGIPVSAMKRGRLGQAQLDRARECAAMFRRWPMRLEYAPGITIADVRAAARHWRRREARSGPGLVVIDHLHLMRASRPTMKEYESLSEITRGLKALAIDLGVPVLLLAQLNRELERREDKRPTLADLRGSGTIEQDADAIVFVHREEEYLRRAEPQRTSYASPDAFDKALNEWRTKLTAVEGRAELIPAKVRENAGGRTVRLGWDGLRTLFDDGGGEAGAWSAPDPEDPFRDVPPPDLLQYDYTR